MRYFISLAYKGTDFHGWQVHLNAVTVQERVNKGLSMLLKEQICFLGAGRTDAGVHAKQMYAHFETDKIFDCEKIQYRLKDISVMQFIVNLFLCVRYLLMLDLMQQQEFMSIGCVSIKILFLKMPHGCCIVI